MRMIFENAKAAFVRAFAKEVPNSTNLDLSVGQKIIATCKLTQGYYRLERPLIAGQTLYTFPVLSNQDVFSNLEKRLILQDSAVVYQIAVLFGAPDPDGDGTDTDWIPDTYPNPIKYPANFQDMNSLYGGKMQITVNSDILIKDWDLLRHYNANQTQQTAALGAGSPLDQNRGSFDGFDAMEPNYTMIGTKDNVIQIQLPVGGIATVQDNSRLIVFIRAIVAQNSTNVS